MEARAKAETIRRIPGTDRYAALVEFPENSKPLAFPYLDMELPAWKIDFQQTLDGYCTINLVRIQRRHRRRLSERGKLEKFLDQDGQCNGCRRKFCIDELQTDHIHPWSLGGGDEWSNLQLLCGPCNKIKGNRPMSYLIGRLYDLYILHPAGQGLFTL